MCRMARSIEKRRCGECGARSLRRARRPFEYDVRYEGRDVRIQIPDLDVIVCTNPECAPEQPSDTIIHDGVSDAQVTEETYRQLNLLTPNDLRRGRDCLDLTQQQMQTLLGLGGNTLSRWETGFVFQSRALDRFLRLFFADERVRTRLEIDDWSEGPVPSERSFDERFPRAATHDQRRRPSASPGNVLVGAGNSSQ